MLTRTSTPSRASAPATNACTMWITEARERSRTGQSSRIGPTAPRG
jgi:hypothetical protein